MLMIPRVDWMQGSDIPILLFLSEHRWRIIATPSVVALNAGLSQTHANRRLKILTSAGLTELYDDRGYYRITDLGERTVLGAVEPEELQDLDPEDPRN